MPATVIAPATMAIARMAACSFELGDSQVEDRAATAGSHRPIAAARLRHSTRLRGWRDRGLGTKLVAGRDDGEEQDDVEEDDEQRVELPEVEADEVGEGDEHEHTEVRQRPTEPMAAV